MLSSSSVPTIVSDPEVPKKLSAHTLTMPTPTIGDDRSSNVVITSAAAVIGFFVLAVLFVIFVSKY
jgi:hypothetical protein